MNLTKDTYEYLLNFAEDRDIINMLSVNKKFRNEEFFERIMKRKYPDLIQYKNENETWKSFFIRIVFYVSLLKEKYKVDYFPGLDLFDVFHGAFNPLYIISSSAAKVGNLKVLKFLNINPQSKFYIYVLRTATRDGQLSVVKYLLSQDPNNAINVGSVAATSGRLDIIKYLIDSRLVEKRDLNNFLGHAAENNQRETVDWLIEHGATDFQSAIEYANNPDMIKYLQTFL